MAAKLFRVKILCTIRLLSILESSEIQMLTIITRKQKINKSPIVNGNMKDGGNFIATYELTGLYFKMLFLMSMITLRRLIPRGQTNMHLPQSIHF